MLTKVGYADVQLFCQEVNPESYAICLADMMIKGQNANNIKLIDRSKLMDLMISYKSNKSKNN